MPIHYTLVFTRRLTGRHNPPVIT